MLARFLLVLVTTAVVSAGDARATEPWRWYLNVNIGGQTSDTFRDPVHLTTTTGEAVTVAPEYRGGFFMGEISVGVRLIQNAGAACTLAIGTGGASVKVDVTSLRDKTITARIYGSSPTRADGFAHLSGWYLVPAGKWQLMLSAGPSFTLLSTDFVSGIGEIVVYTDYSADTEVPEIVTVDRGSTTFHVGIGANRPFGTKGWLTSSLRYVKKTSIEYQPGVDPLLGQAPISVAVGGLQVTVGFGARF